MTIIALDTADRKGVKISHSAASVRAAAEVAAARTADHFLGRQRIDGWWEEPLGCDTTVDADYLIFLESLGREEPAIRAALGQRLAEAQRPDGGWDIFPGGPAELNATVKGYVGLRLAGWPATAPELRAAAAQIQRLGGLAHTNTYTRIYLAVLGMINWGSAPAIPPEMLLAPAGSVLDVVSRMSYWSRCIAVPLSVLWATQFRVSHPRVRISELPGAGTVLPPAPPGIGADLAAGPLGSGIAPNWRTVFLTIDTAFKTLSRLPGRLNPLRGWALRTAERWITDRFTDSEGLGAILPAMINAALALRALGHGPECATFRRAVASVDALLIHDASVAGGRRTLPCTSPVWNTALTALALGQYGLPRDHPALRSAGRALLAAEVRRPGDWVLSARRRGTAPVEPSGWFFQFANGWYADLDDTAMVLMALSKIDLPGVGEALRRGTAWTLALQSNNGGWAAFDADNDADWMTHVPFADHNAMIDPPTADITGRVLEMLGRTSQLDQPKLAGPLRRALGFLWREQRPDGSWFGRWGVNYIYGTWQVLEGLAFVPREHRYAAVYTSSVQRAAERLLAWQNADGGWGESAADYAPPAEFVADTSTPSQTAWAVMGLLAANRADHPAVAAGVAHLIETQRPDGDWEEPTFTGTGFPCVFYLRYPMYRRYFPLLALSKYLAATRT